MQLWQRLQWYLQGDLLRLRGPPDSGRHLDNLAPNGYFFPIDHVLLYTDYVRNVVLNDRLRYTVNMMAPELNSNGIYVGGRSIPQMLPSFIKLLLSSKIAIFVHGYAFVRWYKQK